MSKAGSCWLLGVTGVEAGEQGTFKGLGWTRLQVASPAPTLSFLLPVDTQLRVPGLAQGQAWTSPCLRWALLGPGLCALGSAQPQVWVTGDAERWWEKT